MLIVLWWYKVPLAESASSTIIDVPESQHTWKVSLTHWGRATHIWVSKLTIIGSDNGLSPGQRQAIIWTNVGISLFWSLGTNFSEKRIKMQPFSLKKIHLKMSSANWRPFSPGGDELMTRQWVMSSGSPSHYLNQCWLIIQKVFCGIHNIAHELNSLRLSDAYKCQ